MSRRLAIFPLEGAILFPRSYLPLHIFEPRYRAMISDVMARDQRIGMIQPSGQPGPRGEPPPLFDVGCIGRVAEIEALEDGRFNIILAGESRFHLMRELEVATPFRQVEAELFPPEQDDPGVLAPSERAAIEQESKLFAERLGYVVDWTAVASLDDETLINGIARIAPFDPPGKQALLEADTLSERSELTIQLMQFIRRNDGRSAAPLQ
ncbi:MAG: LON peptidase substrate-binding domain-containing protein [Sphingobium sp.]|nr:LON peptidase substrate-binding domain-containing protein [Sphingobium sp.]